jgi:hypothetical protein
MTDQLSAELGFSFTGHASPPNTVEGLHAAFAKSATTQRPLPVAHQAQSPALIGFRADMRLAFWRSVIRFRKSLNFTMRDELAIDLEILDRAAFEEIPKPSRAVLFAALVGRTMCRAVTGRAALHPRQFVTNVLTYGMTDAILLEHENAAADTKWIPAPTTART